MDIADQFQQVGILLAWNGFVAIVKQVAVAVMTVIIRYGLAGKQTAHDG